MDIQKLTDALAHAVTIIESYEMDIRNSESIIGVDLVAKGFCQGEAYKTALATIRRKTEGVTMTEQSLSDQIKALCQNYATQTGGTVSTISVEIDYYPADWAMGQDHTPLCIQLAHDCPDKNQLANVPASLL